MRSAAVIMLGASVLTGAARAEETGAAPTSSSRGEVSGSIGGVTRRNSGFGLDGVDGDLGVLLWGPRLRDDGAPIDLQAYLQRPNSLAVSASGSWAVSGRDGTDWQRSTRGSLGVSGALWLGPVRIGGSLAGGALTFAPSSRPLSLDGATTFASTSFGLAVRLGTTQLSASWGITVNDEGGTRSLGPHNWGALSFGVTWLYEQKAYFHLTGFNVAGDGVGGRFFVEGYPLQRLSLFLSVFYEDLLRASSSSTYSVGGARLGATGWITRRLSLLIAAELDGTTLHALGASTQWIESGSVGIGYRFR